MVRRAIWQSVLVFSTSAVCTIVFVTSSFAGPRDLRFRPDELIVCYKQTPESL